MNVYQSDVTVIIDHKAIYKHVYHGGQDQEGIFSPMRDKVVPTAEYAFRNYLERYLEPMLAEHSPRQIIVVHDGGHDYRSKLFPDYKVKRKQRERCEIEEEQMNKTHAYLKEFFKRFGIMQCGVAGVEADDLIAHLCNGLDGLKLVYTVDADLLALVREDVMVHLKEVPYTYDDWYKDQIPLGQHNCISIQKALVGDTSDGYPGIKGFGPAKWEDMVDAFGYDGMKEVEAAVDSGNIEPLKQAYELAPIKPLKMILDNWEDFKLQWNIAKLHPELCWKPRGKKLSTIEWVRRIPDRNKVLDMCRSLYCEDLFKEVLETHLPVSYLMTKGEDSPEFIAAIKAEIDKSPFVAFDYESFDENQFECYRLNDPGYVDVLSQKLTGGVLTFGKNLESSVYVSVHHKGDNNVPVATLIELVKYAYERKPLVAHNATFEIIATKNNAGIELDGIYDTMIMSSYADENNRASLKYLSKALLNYDQVSYQATLDAAGAANMAELTPEQVFSYGVDDGITTAYLFDLFQIIMQLEGSIQFYTENDVYPANVLVRAQTEGVVMNREAMEERRSEDAETIEKGMARIRAVLEERCLDSMELDYSGAEKLIEDEKAAQVKLLRGKYKQAVEKASAVDDPAEWVRSETNKAMERWKLRLKEAVSYTPFEVQHVPHAFAPTPKQLSHVTAQLNLDPIEKDSQKYISEWLAKHTVDFSEDTVVELTPEQDRFCKLLGAASKLLKKREGSEYEQLANFCSQYFEGKDVEHGDALSLGSPAQVQELLYCKLGLPLRLRTKPQKGSKRDQLNLPGSPGTDDKVIKMALANDCRDANEWKAEVLELILEVKAAMTRTGLYHTPYPNWISPADGRMHPSIRNCGTVTRRPTGGSPNILQVSKGPMRKIFLPPTPDHVAVPIDFAGQELRIMACQTMDKALLSVYGVEEENGVLVHRFENEKCMHNMTSSGILGVPYEEFVSVYEDEDHPDHPNYAKVRSKKAKGTNFGLSYGAGAETLSRNLTVPVEEADSLLSSAFNTYPGIPEWQKTSAKFAARHGFTQTAFGNRRHMTSDIFSKDRGAQARMERQGANCEIQGTAADMLKIILTKIWTSGMLDRLRVSFFAPIYDEVVSWVHKDDVWQYCVEMNEIMSKATPPSHIVPQIPEFSIGPDWGSVSELGRLPSREVIEQAAHEAWEINQNRLHLWDETKQLQQVA